MAGGTSRQRPAQGGWYESYTTQVQLGSKLSCTSIDMRTKKGSRRVLRPVSIKIWVKGLGCGLPVSLVNTSGSHPLEHYDVRAAEFAQILQKVDEGAPLAKVCDDIADGLLARLGQALVDPSRENLPRVMASDTQEWSATASREPRFPRTWESKDRDGAMTVDAKRPLISSWTRNLIRQLRQWGANSDT